MKESHESSQQRNLQVAPAAVDTCFTVHFTTSSEEEEENNGSTSPAVKKKSGRGRKKGKKSKFFIVGYGEVPPDCQETGAACDIEICGTRNKLDIVLTQTKDMWRFSITGDIGPLLYHDEHPTSNEKNIAGFPTNMGGSFDVFQSYQLVLTPAQEAQRWIDTDSFSSTDDIIMVSRIVIRYILWTHQEPMKDSTLKILLYCLHSLTFGPSFVFHQFRTNDSLS